MTKAQRIYREVRKYLNRADARYFTIKVLAGA